MGTVAMSNETVATSVARYVSRHAEGMLDISATDTVQVVNNCDYK